MKSNRARISPSDAPQLFIKGLKMITRKAEYDLERVNKYNEKPRYKLTLRLNFYKREATKNLLLLVFIEHFLMTFYLIVLKKTIL